MFTFAGSIGEKKNTFTLSASEAPLMQAWVEMMEHVLGIESELFGKDESGKVVRFMESRLLQKGLKGDGDCEILKCR